METIDEIFNKEIARELLIEADPDITDDIVDRIYEACKGNPWNAPALYKIMKLMG
jgi:hypothetical protein